MTVDAARSVRNLFVDGQWAGSESGETFDATSPATGEVIAPVAKDGRADAERAVEAAQRSRAALAGPRGFERSLCLVRIAEAKTSVIGIEQ